MHYAMTAVWLKNAMTRKNVPILMTERNSRTRLHDVVCGIIMTLMTQFRMVAEHTLHRALRLYGRLREVYQKAEQGLHYRVYSALLVEPTHLDPTSGSTRTWFTGSIIMLYVTAPILRRNTELALRRRNEGQDGVPADEAVPQVPDLPQDYDPFMEVQRKHVNEYKEAFHHYSRILQYVLTKVTKGEVYRLVVQCNHNNSSGFETWRRLRFTYDQGEKAQHLAQLARIMKPTWNNVNQQPNEFIKTFQHWRDEIYNYEQSIAELPSEMKMTLLIQSIQGDTKSHMLMNYKLSTANFNESCTRVEDYHRNVYVDNSAGQVAGVQNPKKKKPWPPWKRQPWKNGYGKGKYDYDKGKGGKDKGGKDNPWKGGYDKGYRKGKGRGYGKPWSKGKGKGDKGYIAATTTTTTAMANQKVTTTGKERTKEMEESRKDHHYHRTTATTGKERRQEKEKVHRLLLLWKTRPHE
eukprot:975006-Amphidinium_carterae.2